LRDFEANNIQDAESRKDAKSSKKTHKAGRGLRLFTMLPLTHFTRQYVLIDSTALYETLSRVKAEKGKSDKEKKKQKSGKREYEDPNSKPWWEDFSKEKFDSNIHYWWELAFKLNKVVTSGRRFGYSVSTDGLGVSAHLLRPAPEWNGVNDHGFGQDGAFHPLGVSSSDRVVGLDPGRRDLFVAVHGEHKKDKVKCSTKEWYSITGFTRAKKKRETWLKNNQELQKIVQGECIYICVGIAIWVLMDCFMCVDIPTYCTSAIATYRKYLEYVLQHINALLEFYGKIRWRRLRWKGYIGRQKGYNIVSKRITAGKPTTVVAFGAAGFSSSSRGHAAGPVKGLYQELKKRCRTIKVDEFRTSMLCSECDVKLDGFRRIWGVKRCNTTDCVVSI
jgi:hypothetical protein